MFYDLFAPLQDVDRMFEEMNRLADRDFARRADFPRMNILADEENVEVRAEVPGVAEKDLSISMTGDTLTVSGNRPEPTAGTDVTWHRHERGAFSWSRSIQLPFRVDPESSQADLSDGVLTVTLQRSSQDRPRKIDISKPQTPAKGA
jgi:HSP20 family protein